jgi:hypothetical protein
MPGFGNGLQAWATGGYSEAQVLVQHYLSQLISITAFIDLEYGFSECNCTTQHTVSSGGFAFSFSGLDISCASAVTIKKDGQVAYSFDLSPGSAAFGMVMFDETNFDIFAALDWNGDGRRSCEDFNELLSLLPISVMPADTLAPFDANQDGVVTALEVQSWSTFFCGDFADGMLGDFDASGVADCDDLAAVLGISFGTDDPASLGVRRPGYSPVADSDLDGDNDLFDRGVILRLIQPADLTEDGILDFGDVSLFSAAYAASDPDADINGDVLVDFGDVSAFNDSYNNPCP